MVRPQQIEVTEKLHQVHFQRNKSAWLLHTVLISVSTYFQREKLLLGDTWWQAILLVLGGLVLRNLVLRVFFNDWRSGKKAAIFLNDFGLFVLSVGWSLHFAAIFYAYGADSYNASHTLLVIAGIMVGASIASAAHKRSFHIVALTLIVSIFIMYFKTGDSADHSVLFYIVFFYAYCTYFLQIGHKELKRSIENEVIAQKEKNRIASIIDTVPGVVGLFDENLICVLANKAFLATYPTIVGKKIGSFEKNSNWEQFLSDFQKGDKDLVVDEASFSIGKRQRWVLRNCHRSDDNGLVFVSMDITDLVVARNRLRDQEGKAHYSAKLASLGEMAAGIAHEINNPLTIIQGSASVIQQLVDIEPMDKDSIKLLTSKLIQTSNRISKTIRSLKTLSRSGENDPFEEIDFVKVLDQCLDICGQRCTQYGIKLKLPSFNGPVMFKGRDVQISQVLMNLISNAMDAIKEDKDPWIEVNYQYGEDALDIYVSDSGSGVPESIRNKIMDPFFTTKEVNQGTGLGLSISKSIMQAHHGELTLMEGTHTTFRMHLPAF